MGNALVNAVFEFVDEWLERLPEQLDVARNNFNTAEINLDDAEADYNDWLQNDGITLSECMIEKSYIIRQLKDRNEDGSLAIRAGHEKRCLNVRKAELNATVKRLQACKKEKLQRVEGLKRILRAMNDARREVEKNLCKVNRPIWEQIEEECFVKLGIERPYYHGGK